MPLILGFSDESDFYAIIFGLVCFFMILTKNTTVSFKNVRYLTGGVNFVTDC